jgi:hypothetical protein
MSWPQYVILCLSLLVLWNDGIIRAEEIISDEEIVQWRDELEHDIDLWAPLIGGVYNAIALSWDAGNEQAVSRWKKVRSDLVLALQQNPDSPSVTEIKIKMATMDVEILKDKKDAIQLLQSIISTKSKVPIVHFGIWLGLVNQCSRWKNGGGLQILPLDDVLKTVKNSLSLKAQFAAVCHLKKFPVMVSEVATLALADIYTGEGMLDEAAAILEMYLHENSNSAAMLVAEDKKYKQHPDGYFITTIQRPIASAMSKLMKLYSKQGKTDAAIAIGETLGLKLSEDGWYHGLINEPLADIYLRQGNKSKAGDQYKVALSGYIEELKREADIPNREGKRVTLLDKEYRITRLKKAIRDSGGKIGINTKELKQIFKRKK